MANILYKRFSQDAYLLPKEVNNNKLDQKFLEKIPPQLSEIKPVYQRALEGILKETLDEEELERLDEKVEGFLYDSASDIEKEKIHKNIEAQFPAASQAESEHLFRVLLIKHLRHENKIPHLSPIYY